KRMSLPATRALVNLALAGELDNAPKEADPVFGFLVPTAAEGVDPAILRPRDTWADKAAYDTQARKLAAMFTENFQKCVPFVTSAVRFAPPVPRAAHCPLRFS